MPGKADIKIVKKAVKALVNGEKKISEAGQTKNHVMYTDNEAAAVIRYVKKKLGRTLSEAMKGNQNAKKDGGITEASDGGGGGNGDGSNKGPQKTRAIKKTEAEEGLTDLELKNPVLSLLGKSFKGKIL
jgi:hypothetical protein